jgi:hypothetical protein
VTDPEIERYIVEIHATVATLVERSVSVDAKLTGIIARQDVTNGAVAAVKTEQLRQDGAVAAVKWMVVTLIAVTGVGTGVAGVILTLVAR